jgi:hypothetical protein
MRRPSTVLFLLGLVACAGVVYLAWRPRSAPGAAQDDGDQGGSRWSPAADTARSRVQPVRSPPPPNFSAGPGAQGVVVDPGAKGYDPTAVKLALNVPVSELFAKETRDPVWAPRVEKYLHDMMESDLRAVLPRATFEFKTECRSSTCVAQVTFPDDLTPVERMAATLVGQSSGIGDAVEVKFAGQMMSLEMAIAPANRSPDAMKQERTVTRNALLEQIAAPPAQPIPENEKALNALLRRIPPADPSVEP